jgi:hypothetical protein
MFKKILYIGAGDDRSLLDLFPSSDFVFIDSLPRNEYGYFYYYRGFYRTAFKKGVLQKLADTQWIKTGEKVYSTMYSEINVPDLEPHRVSFQRGKQKLDYYFSTGIPENLYIENKPHQELQTSISECDAIFVKGHFPDESVLEYMQPHFHVICGADTYFPEHNDDDKSIISRLIDDKERVSTYLYVDSSNTCRTFENYASFYQFYKETSITNDE